MEKSINPNTPTLHYSNTPLLQYSAVLAVPTTRSAQADFGAFCAIWDTPVPHLELMALAESSSLPLDPCVSFM